MIQDYLNTKYPEYEFMPEWAKFIETLGNNYDSIGLFFKTVNGYALDEIEPEGLTPEISDFFNSVVRPELDQQHRKFNRRKSKRNGRR